MVGTQLLATSLALVAEAHASLLATSLAKANGWDSVVFETDCQLVLPVIFDVSPSLVRGKLRRFCF
ncbi:hypothetical protein TIFTF001_026555 [Ficus carica]|uniref:RNase H type-1 domain-containing protein n=1 Tax=Ficus carica TaxID=3494 RepID=A0AA88DM04_FICCA|nr:hypothetical protein TIFTF001_026555 [Ficus carica]